MSIPAISRQIGKTKLSISGNQKYQYVHTLSHFVKDADIASYKFEAQSVLDSDLFDIPSGAVCLSQTWVGCGTMGWNVVTTAGSGTYVPVLPDFTSDSYYSISYSTGEFVCQPKYWGLRIATKVDADAILMARRPTTAGSSAIIEDCEIGDWLQTNATSTSAGTFNMVQCPIGSDTTHPFPNAESDAHFDWYGNGTNGYLNQKLATMILTVTYVATKSPHQYSTFTGVNPSSFSGTPGSLIPLISTAGVWKAKSQSITPINSKGITKYKVTRSMESAPKVYSGMQTAWLVSKNGGYWTW